MWNAWIFWISSTRLEILLLVVAPLLIIDAPRYALTALGIWSWDATARLRRWLRGGRHRPRFSHCPSVCAIVAGFNEATRELFRNAVVRLTSTEPERAPLPLPHQVLNTCRLVVRRHEYVGLKATLSNLKKPLDDPEAIHIAFLTAGAPFVSVQDELNKAKAERGLALMNVDPQLVWKVNDATGGGA